MAKSIISGIYSITSPSGKLYIGSSRNIDKRWREHKNQLLNNKHHSPVLQKAFKKYGIDNLVFDLKLVCEEKDLLVYEQQYLDFYQPAYNICPTAGSNAGRKLTDGHKAKISSWSKTKKLSSNHIEALRQSRLGVKASDETKTKISEVAKNRIFSKETLEKFRINKTGTTLSEESKRKISLSKIGRKRQYLNGEKTKWILIG